AGGPPPGLLPAVSGCAPSRRSGGTGRVVWSRRGAQTVVSRGSARRRPAARGRASNTTTSQCSSAWVPGASPQARGPLKSASWQAGRMIVVTEHRAGDDFLAPATQLLEVLAAAEGFISGQVGRSPDEPDIWIVSTRWRDVGSMRRGFGSFDAKVAAAPVMLSASDRVSAYEVLVQATPGELVDRSSDRA